MARRGLVAAYLCKRTMNRTSLSARSGDGGAEFRLAHAGGGIGIQIGITAQGFSHAVVHVEEHRGQGREELGGESGPLKLRQLSGFLIEFFDDRQAWKRRPEESGINDGEPRQACTSSRVSAGYSAKTSSPESPAPRNPRTVYTAMRVPRTTGRPLQISGSSVIRSGMVGT